MRSRRKKHKGECFWFSGISGTGVREALHSLQTFFQEEHDRTAEIVSVEKSVLATFNPELSWEQPGVFKAVVDEPTSTVRKLWKEAASKAAKEAEQHLNAGKDVFFTFHGIYFTDKYSDFYSPLDVSVVQRFPPPKTFINLIDDIGDVAARLRRDSHVFSNRPKTGIDSVNEAIHDLLTILEWRSQELVVSRLLGPFVGKEPIILAVKHPTNTAAKILLGQGTLVYVSHSISEARNYCRTHPDWPPFMGEVQRFSDELASNNQIIPILPTTIDEFRIDDKKINGLRSPTPSCLARWDTPKQAPLVSRVEKDDWLDPRHYFGGPGGNGKSKKNKQEQDELKALQGLLEALHNRIGNQVNARDHLLVAQCPILVVYRPYRMAWGIKESGGSEGRNRTQRQAAE